MSHSTLRLTLLASAVVLGGCTVYVNKTPPNNQTQTARQTTTSTTPTRTTTGGLQPKTTTTTPQTQAEAPRINGHNAFGNGTVGAFRGQAYVIPNTTTRVPDFSKLTPFATLFTDSFIAQAQPFTAGFPGVLMQDEWFAIKYEGNFDIARDGNYLFTLNTDDGANLYIDNEKIVDNDGLHAAKAASATKTLKAGRHTLRLEYFQGAKGSIALSLNMTDGTSVDKAARPLVGAR
jgi:hypothetical protein